MTPIRSLSAALLLTASAAALSSFAFAADPIKIGVPVGLSGANSVVAPSVVQSAQLAVDEINAKGGVLGRQLVLEVADDASGAAGAQKAFDALISWVVRQPNGPCSVCTTQARPIASLSKWTSLTARSRPKSLGRMSRPPGIG